MGKVKDLTPRKVSEIKALLKNSDHSQRSIASIAGVAKSSVDRIKKKLDLNLTLSPSRLGKCGRKKSTSPRDERQIRNIVIQHRRAPRRILTILIQDAGIEISPMTVRRRIKELGFSCCSPPKKPFLNQHMMKQRLSWVKEHKNWTVDDWKRVI